MNQSSKDKKASLVVDRKVLLDHLYTQSSVFTRSAHALVAASEQLLEAHSSDFAIAAVEAQTASLVAMHAALSAHHLVGAYELAGWLQRISQDEKGNDRRE